MEKYKDPAFLFYPADFLIGVMYMSDEEIGQYIKLICVQHQKGHLPSSIIDKVSPAVKDKFVQDDDGKWYNRRLEKEIEKRSKYTSSRRKNLEGSKDGTVAEWIKEIVPPELQEPFKEWAQMRNKIKKPITTKATVTRNYNQLCKLSKRIDKQRQIIEQSVDRCWQSFYELKEEQKPRAYKEFEKEKEIDAVPMPEEVRVKAEKLGIKIGGEK